MKDIICFKTEDGLIFESKDEAQQHTTHLKFVQWYKLNTMPLDFGEIVDRDTVGVWLAQHWDELARIFGKGKAGSGSRAAGRSMPI